MKIFSLSIVLALLLLGSGCQSSNSQEGKVLQKNQLDQTTYDPVNFPADFIVFHDQDAVSQAIAKNLKDGKKIKEITEPTTIAIPSQINKKQFAKFFELGNYKFALVQQASMNTGYFDNPTPYAGIWYGVAEDKEWKPFMEIKNDRTYTENNPFYLWTEGDKLFLLLADARGAGSGEGTGKIFTSKNGGKNWDKQRCFSFVPDLYFEAQRQLRLNFYNGWLKKNLTTPLKLEDGKFSGGFAQFEYVYNSTTGNFEFEQILKKGSTEKEMVIIDTCKNIILP